MQNNVITYENTSDLTLHKNPIPEQDPDSPEFIALADSIQERGIDVPLICLGNRIVDGRARWRAAKRYQVKTVPVTRCTEDEVATIMISSLVHRRHLTKSAIAYVSFPLMAAALEESKRRRAVVLDNVSHLNALTLSNVKNAEDLSEQIGISRKLFFEAQKVHQLFAKSRELKDQFEPGILSGENYLGAVIAGIAGQESTKGRPKADYGQLDLFTVGVETLGKRFTYWEKFDLEQKETAVKTIRATVAKMPKDLRGEWERAIRMANKQEEQR